MDASKPIDEAVEAKLTQLEELNTKATSIKKAIDEKDPEVDFQTLTKLTNLRLRYADIISLIKQNLYAKSVAKS